MLLSSCHRLEVPDPIRPVNPFDDEALAELEAMKGIADLLRVLKPDVAVRVVEWAWTRLGRGHDLRAPPQPPSAVRLERLAPYSAFGDLFAAAQPSSGPERALVAAYWIQKCGGNEDFEAAEITRLLTDAGHKLSNTGATLRQISDQKPVLVIQTSKKGSSKQARKRYRLTGEGQKRVEALLAAAS